MDLRRCALRRAADIKPQVAGALAGVTAAVVGVILNLSFWFALHVFFGTVEPIALGPLQLSRPDIATLNIEAVALAGLAAFLLFRMHTGIAATLAISAVASLAWYYVV